VDKNFAIGDVHGSNDSLLKVLINNKIIDHNQNCFWNGPLYSLEIFLDRGDKVTEVLWLAYSFGTSTQISWKVHLLLGNHELLILNKIIAMSTKSTRT
jgi:hypothetical protein